MHMLTRNSNKCSEPSLIIGLRVSQRVFGPHFHVSVGLLSNLSSVKSNKNYSMMLKQHKKEEIKGK